MSCILAANLEGLQDNSKGVKLIRSQAAVLASQLVLLNCLEEAHLLVIMTEPLLSL